MKLTAIEMGYLTEEPKPVPKKKPVQGLYKQITQERQDEVWEMYKQVRVQSKVAEIMGLTKTMVHRIVNKRNGTDGTWIEVFRGGNKIKRSEELIAAIMDGKMTRAEIMREFDVSHQTVRRYTQIAKARQAEAEAPAIPQDICPRVGLWEAI